MKKNFTIFTLLLLTFFASGVEQSQAALEAYYWQEEMDRYEAMGYSCYYYKSDGVTPANGDFRGLIVCFKTVGYTYGANVTGPYSLTGTQNSVVDRVVASDWQNSPFIYFSNPPQGDISVTLSSKLNSFSPQPLFNKSNGWNLVGDKQKGTVSLDGKEQKNLFYELGINSMTLTRHGQNFSSKEEITSYLKNSNFFDQLGFSSQEKENSLNYVLRKLQDSKENKKYYYLTILTDDSISNISTLTIKPAPKKVLRDYFAIYPTDVPVKTEGNFVFPKKQKLGSQDFVVKETGEFLVPSNMIVFFK